MRKRRMRRTKINRKKSRNRKKRMKNKDIRKKRRRMGSYLAISSKPLLDLDDKGLLRR